MLATSHAIVGGTIAVAVPDNVLLQVGLILVSHFILDIIPHWDLGTEWESRSKTQTGLLAIGETLVAAAIMWLLFHNSLSFLAGSIAFIAAQLPDWLQAPWYILFARTHKPNSSWLARITYELNHIQDYAHTRCGLPKGLLTQITICLFFWLLLMR